MAKIVLEGKEDGTGPLDHSLTDARSNKAPTPSREIFALLAKGAGTPDQNALRHGYARATAMAIRILEWRRKRPLHNPMVRKLDAYRRAPGFVTSAQAPPPTSHLLQTVFDLAPRNVTLEWLFGKLPHRSFGIILIFLGLVAAVPGVCVLGGLGLAILGIQMLMARDAPILPRFLAVQSLPRNRVAPLVNRTVAVIEVLERFVRPRWYMPFGATKRLVGLIILLLAATIFIPIPLSNVLPGALAMLVAFAYLEQDGIVLSMALTASVASLLISATEIWGGVRGVDLLLRL